jgi:hypothetical protein
MEVRARLDLLPSALVGTLSPPGGKVSRGMEGRLTGYPRDQVLAILAFLRHEEAADADEATDSSRRVMARAIKYWNGLAG